MRGPRHRHARRRRGHAGERHALRDRCEHWRRRHEPSSTRPRPRATAAARPPVEAVGTGLRDRLQQFLAFASLIAIFLFFSIASSVLPHTTRNLAAILIATVVIGMLALGTTFVIITGGIDLSIGTGMTLCAVISGVLIVNGGVPVLVGVHRRGRCSAA